MNKNFDYQKLVSKLKFYLKHDQNVLLEGRAGTGKTTIISQVFNDEFGEGNWLYLCGATMDPFIDFVGVPREEKDDKGNSYLDFVLPKHFVLNDVKAIFIDEYNRSHKKVRNGCMELIQFKSVNGKKFKNLKCVWVGINPFTDEELEQSYDVEQLDPAQLDRFQIQIKLPYQVSLEYFSKKYKSDNARSAVEWWNQLPEKTKLIVSPRRLEYAMEVYNMGGDIFDVLPLESNPSKLLTLLTIGNIEDKLAEVFSQQSYDKGKKLLEPENNYQSAIPVILKSKHYTKFFLPIFSQERIVSLFFRHKEIQEYILKNPLYFKDSLNEIVEADSCEDYTKKNILRALKSVESMEFAQ